MTADRGLIAGLEAGRWNVPTPIQIVIGTLLGLVYIIVLPFVGLASFVLLGSYRALLAAAAMWRKAKSHYSAHPAHYG